jgi:low affinity Fe/Cu permease
MGHPAAFLIATATCLIWAVTGPLFHYSDTWQLVINTATTVLTFLAVFLIQNSQNRDGIAIQAKLDEILIAFSKARTELVGIENLTDAQVVELKAAIEREALEPDSKDASAPTVDEILKNREQELEEKIEEMPAGDRREVAKTAKRAVAAAADKVKSEGKNKRRKTAPRARAKKPAPSKRR